MSEPAPEPAAPKKRRRRKRKKRSLEQGAVDARPVGVAERKADGQPGSARPSAVQQTGSGQPGTEMAPRAARRSVEELAAETYRSLDALIAALARDEGLGPMESGEATLVPLVLGRGMKAEVSGERRVDALVAHLREHLRVALGGMATFREGAVYCFHTDQPESQYSRPAKPTDVFAGYAANGRPEWVGFANLCLERREPRVDRLFGERPEVLALVLGPDELASGMLPEFSRGRLGYRLLGQVVVGLVPRDLEPRSREERVALTLQVVETSEPDGRGRVTRRLRLNVIGLPSQVIAEVAAERDEASPAEGLRKVLRATRGRVDGLGQRAALAQRQGGVFELEEPVRQLLTRLRGDVLRVLKSRDYRTQHATERHQSGERPTALAVTDALAAGDGKFFRDEHKDTVVVLGPKSRVHVFSRGGKHVTSLELTPAEVERRVDLKRWKFLERAMSELFKGTLRRQLEERGGDGP